MNVWKPWFLLKLLGKLQGIRKKLFCILKVDTNPDLSAAAGGLEDVQGHCLTVSLLSKHMQSIRKSRPFNPTAVRTDTDLHYFSWIHASALRCGWFALQSEHAFDCMNLCEFWSCDQPCLPSVQLDQEARWFRVSPGRKKTLFQLLSEDACFVRF